LLLFVIVVVFVVVIVDVVVAACHLNHRNMLIEKGVSITNTA
jgi:hypothetical protein